MQAALERGAAVFDLHPEHGLRIGDFERGKGGAQAVDGQFPVDKGILPRAAGIEAEVGFAAQGRFLSEQLDERCQVEIVRAHERVDFAVLEQGLLPWLPREHRFEGERQEQFAAQEARAAAEHLEVLHGEASFAEVDGRRQGERSAVEKETTDINIARRIAGGELAVDRDRVHVAGKAHEFDGGHAGMRRGGAVAVPKKKHPALARPVGSETSERFEVARNLAQAEFEAALI